MERNLTVELQELAEEFKHLAREAAGLVVRRRRLVPSP
jgi:hypothetical protein